MSLRRLLKAAALALGLAAPAVAGVATNSVSYQTYANYTVAHVKAVVTGDDDSSAVLRLQITTPEEYRLHGVTAFDSAMVMTRRYGGGTGGLYGGAFLWLLPGTKYYWRCELTDEDGGGATSAIDSFTTRTIPNCPTSGTRLYVNKNGDDSWDGTSPTFVSGLVGPKLTIGSALTAMNALGDDGANGGIVVGRGIYRERLNVNFGTDAAGVYRFISGDGVNPDSTIIDGSAEPGANQQLSWNALNSGSADSTYWALCTWGDSISTVVVGWGEYIHKKTNKQGIFDNEMGERSGWAWVGDTLFVKRRDGSSPAGVPLHAGYRIPSTQDQLLLIQKRNWIIKKLTFRFSGAVSGTAAHAIQWGATGVNASGGIVDSCKFYGISGYSSYNTLFAVNGKADSTTISRNTVRGLGIGGMTYQAAKSRQEENSLRLAMWGGNGLIYGNTVYDAANGPTSFGGESDSTAHQNTEVSYNTVSKMSDDGIELDLGHAIGVVAYKNTINRTLSGISITSVSSGPLFVLYNTITGYGYNSGGGAIKTGGTNTNGRVLIYHNTMTTKAGATAAPAVTVVGTPAEGLSFRNNIMVGSGSGTYIISASAVAPTNWDFNYNAYDSVGVTRHARVNATDYSIGTAPATATWQSTRTWDKNGPGRVVFAFADSANNNFKLSGTAGVDGGMRIAGVNTDHRGNRYKTAPDCGAYERSWPFKRSWVSRLIRRRQ